METVGFHEQPRLVQTLMGVWVPDRGWAVTKRGMIYGGRHGGMPLIEDLMSEEVVIIEARSGLRALQSVLKREGLL